MIASCFFPAIVAGTKTCELLPIIAYEGALVNGASVRICAKDHNRREFNRISDFPAITLQIRAPACVE
jgi:hypothetical protein